MDISNRFNRISPSMTLQLSKKANDLKECGEDVISLTVGEPYFDTPQNVKNAAKKAIDDGFTKYTNTDGIRELKEAVRDKFFLENNISYRLDEITISSGAKQVLYNLFMASLNSKDEVIILSPYWVSYPDMVLLAGGVPVIVPFNSRAKIVADDLKNYINSNSKWIILNSPNNPSGLVYSKDELESFANLLRQYKNLNIISDDIYEHTISGENKFYTIAAIAPDLKDRIFTVNGVSKAYSMTGWRIGYGAGDAKLIKAMNVLQSHSTSNPCSISQKAAIEALNHSEDFIIKHKTYLHEVRQKIITALEYANIKFIKPDGAFYILLSCDGLELNSTEFADYLLEEWKIAVVPGVAFGAEGYIRISYDIEEEKLDKAIDRIIKAYNTLCNKK
jgi:aspartate aminotransferase